MGITRIDHFDILLPYFEHMPRSWPSHVEVPDAPGLEVELAIEAVGYCRVG